MILRIGLNDDFEADVVADAIYYAVNNEADVVNMSFGSPPSVGIPDIKAAVNYAWANGVLLVAASGNDECIGSGCLLLPARLSKVMAVGATTHTDSVAGYSNGGPELNLVAPGGHTTQSSATKVYSTLGANSYGYMSGTSMAAPHVCGGAALALSADPTLTVTELWKLLEFSTDDEAGTASEGWENNYGWGRLNIDTMVDAIEYVAHSGYTYPSADCKVFCPAADADSFVITVTIEDENEDPIAGIPATAIWAEPKVSTFDLCCVEEDTPDCIIEYPNRVFAQSATDTLGQTAIVIKAAGGNGKFTPVRVMLYGLQLPGLGLLELIPFRSYDIDKDCDVDAADFTIFNGIMGTRDARGDFDCDGDVDSADSLLLAAHSGHACPGRSAELASAAPTGHVSLDVSSRPNPFSPSTEIACSLPTGPVSVDLAIYSAGGRRVRTLYHGEREAGLLSVTWDGADDAGHRVASGVYFCRITAGGAAEVQKLILLK